MDRKVENINPYGSGGQKHDQVRRMFNNIAPAYDSMNTMMSFGLDRRWRDTLVDAVAGSESARILDIATGTGDIAIAMARAIPGASVTGIDLSEGMVALGRRKVADAGLDTRVTLTTGDALALPFDDDAFDAVTVAYGVRNFEHLDRGYAEMLRVLRPGGRLFVLELTTPQNILLRPGYAIYTRAVIPVLGRLMSGDYHAYSYLLRSIRAVPMRRAMCSVITGAGFADAAFSSLFPGVCALYTATKPVTSNN